MPVKDDGLLKEESIKALIASNHGITNDLIAQHYNLHVRSVAQWIAMNLSTAKWLFTQLRGSTKHYYIMEYAIENKIPDRILSKRKKGDPKWDTITEKNHTDHIELCARLAGLWPSPKVTA